MRNLIVKLGLLAALVLLLNLAVDRLVLRGKQHYANPTIDAKMDGLRQSETRYDFLVIGSSRVIRQVDPTVLGAALPGRRIFNLGAEGFAVPGIWAVAEDLVEGYLAPGSDLLLEFYYYNKPAAINMHKPDSFYNYNLERLLVLIHSLWLEDISVKRKISFSFRHVINFVERLLHFGTMSSLLLPAPSQDAARLAAVLGPARDGFYPLDADLRDFPERTDIVARRELWTRLPEPARLAHMRNIAAAIAAGGDAGLANPAMIDYSRKLHDAARQRGIRLRFFMPPSQTDAKAYASFQALPEAMRLPLYQPADHPEIYEPQHYFDGGHLDSTGANRFSRILAGQLAGH